MPFLASTSAIHDVDGRDTSLSRDATNAIAARAMEYSRDGHQQRQSISA
jgi:hypothetical protein